MGNVDSRSQFESGHLQLQTDRPYYSPGEVVTGTIYMRLHSQVADANFFNLELKGIEFGQWRETIYKTERHGNRVETKVEHVWRTSERKIIEKDYPVYKFPSSVLQPGDYSVPFQF